MQRIILPAFVTLAALAGAVLAQAGGQPATLVVRVPADAKVVVGSQQTTQTGIERRFVSPELVPGYTYSYQVEARWTAGGKEVTVSRWVEFKPGQTAVVDLRKPAPETKVAEIKPKPETKIEKKPETKPEPKVVKVEKKPEVKPQPPVKVETEAGFVALFNGSDLSGWKTIPEKSGKTYTVQDGAVIVAGNPAGYFYTDKSYQNYVLRFDWRYKRPANLEDDNKFGGNSGLLVRIQEPHKIWPKSLEVQGMNRDHGSLIGIGVKVTNAKFDRAALEKARNKVGEWNTTEATINGDTVTVKVNGALVTTANFELGGGGPFGFQSEGAELHFKNIRIKTLPDSHRLRQKLGGATDLFNGKNLDGWKTFMTDPSADPAKSFIVKDGEIQLPGFPNGYFYTDKSYKNYALTYEWTYPKDQPEKTTMNSGCLVHIQAPHKVWPKSVEPQGRYKDHGKLFFIGFSKEDKKEDKFDDAALQKALKASHEWNGTEVTCKADGSITVKVNGALVSEGRTALTEGPIGFQSEGARIHFRNIKIKPLD